MQDCTNINRLINFKKEKHLPFSFLFGIKRFLIKLFRANSSFHGIWCQKVYILFKSLGLTRWILDIMYIILDILLLVNIHFCNYIYIYFFFSNTHWQQLTAPFYSILFEKFSSIMPDEVREHLTRDQRPFLHPESLQILQIHSSMMVLLLFSSPHSFSVGFRSEDWNGQQKLGFVLSDPFLCCFWGLCLDYCPVGRSKHGFFYLLVFDRIHDVMCLNKMSRTSSRNIGPQH